MKKIIFLLAAFIFLLASCSQISKDEAETTTLNISGKSLLARAELDEIELNEVYNLTIDMNDITSGLPLKNETQKGTISELQNKTFVLTGIEVGKIVKFYCKLSKEGIPGYFWQGESEAVKITGGENISIRMLETNPSGDTTPLTILDGFIPSTTQLYLNKYEGKYQFSTQYKFTASSNKRKIKAGDKYTLTLYALFPERYGSDRPNADANVMTIKGFYFNICDKKAFDGSMDYSQSTLSKAGAYGDLDVIPGQRIEFKKTITIEKDAPDEIVLDLTFPMENLPEYMIREYEEENFEMSLELENVICNLSSSNVEIEKKPRDRTPLIMTTQPEIEYYGHYINKEQARNDFSNKLLITSNTNNQRILQEGDEFYVNLNATIDAEITGGFFIIGDYGDLQDWDNIMLCDGYDILMDYNIYQTAGGLWNVSSLGHFIINKDAKTKNPVVYLILFTADEPGSTPKTPELSNVNVIIESSNVTVKQ